MSKTGAGVENLRTYGRTKKVIDQSAIKFTDLLNLQPKEKKEATTANTNTKPVTSEPATNAGTSRSRRVAAVTAAANLKQPKTTNPKATSKRKSIENDSSKDSNSNSQTNNNLASAAAAVVDLKLFQSSSTSSSSTSHHSEQHESIDLRKKRISESATATAIVSNSMSIDMEATSSSANSAPKLKSIVKPTPPQQQQHPVETIEPQQPATMTAATAMATAMGRPKRVVRILEELDVKKDRILENVKPDNKQKHTASTSTPSGGRRKPLKAPQDVSLIVRSETAANQSK